MRFPEFSGEWESTPISTIADIIGGGTPDTSVDEYWGGNIQWFTPSEIGKEKYAYLSDRTITEAGLKNSSAKLLPQGTVLLSTRATIGECSIATAECTTNQGFQSLVAKKNNVSSEFLYYIVAKIKREMLRKSCGSTFLEISANELKKIHANIPSKAEQEKLVFLLSLIDQRIETQKKIIEDLKKLKYAINKRVFENHGSSDSMLLGRVADIYQPQTIPTSWLNNTLQYPVYGANGVIGKYSEYNHENSQICIACRGNTCGTVNYSEPKSWITGNAMVINTDRYDINKRFLFHQLCTVNYNPLISGSGQPQIVRRPLEKMKIWFPNKDVQERIATLFDTLENRILIEETALGLIEKTKQYLLLQMFI